MKKLKSDLFFSVKEVDGHWWFIDPEGNPFFSIGLNHIDSTGLRYPDNIHIWREKYQSDQMTWIKKGVAENLKKWGFNTIGWVQEAVLVGEKNNRYKYCMHRHSNNWTVEEYQAAGIPYCHMLPFAEVHQWDLETRHPDVFNEAFEDWCDYVARHYCTVMADDPNLIGYFFSDCPNWIHPSYNPKLKGPWFNPNMLNSKVGRQEFKAAIDQYYKTIVESIRRYDKNHLILGDRLEGKQPLPDIVINTAAKYVDVLSFQYFDSYEKILSDFQKWHEMTGLPILLADAPVPRKRSSRKEFMEEGVSYEGQGEEYISYMRHFFKASFMVGWHYCGAYMENRERRFGLLNRFDEPNEEITKYMSQINHEIQESDYI